MFRIPINCQIARPGNSVDQSGQCRLNISTILKLKGNWIIECVWDESYCKYRPGFIEIYHSVSSKEMLVGGKLSVTENLTVVSTVEFLELMETESSRVKENLVYSKPLLVQAGNCFYIPDYINSSSYSLIGVIYVSYCKDTWDFNDEECELSAQPNSLKQLSNDLEQLLDSQTCCFADVNLNCVGGPIPAHKVILSARSPVFAAMFKHPMKENQKNQVDVTDMDATIFKAMLTYIYTGKTSSLTISSASDLLFAADKYQLQDLKRVCCDFLKKNTSLENVLTILVLGDLHAPDLKSFAVDYIAKNCTNFSEFQNREEWKSLRKGRPILAMDVLASLVIYRDKK